MASLLAPIYGVVGTKRFKNRLVATFRKFLKINTKLKNILHLKTIELFLFAINGKTMKSCF